ncbi:hypothetical protein sr13900 [Sporisorium reilianum SRZ2]|uniref:Uncharacterized protein n=1 Tax=Sporisorium reilianum (strain SRZ2) TaxID=999809 RepID=E7A183_SPORE|nr:hypothetical protein sr13900 [Sporisorium reilianum SRZ2]
MRLSKASLLFAATVLQCAATIKALGKDEVILGEDVWDDDEADTILRVWFQEDRRKHCYANARVAESFKIDSNSCFGLSIEQGKSTKGSDWYDYLSEVGVSLQDAAKEVPDEPRPVGQAAGEVVQAARNVGEEAGEAAQEVTSLGEEVSSVRP